MIGSGKQISVYVRPQHIEVLVVVSWPIVLTGLPMQDKFMTIMSMQRNGPHPAVPNIYPKYSIAFSRTSALASL